MVLDNDPYLGRIIRLSQFWVANQRGVMMLKIQVETTVVDLKTGTSAKTGKPYAIREQEAWAYLFGRDGKPYPHPQKIRLTLDDDQQPYEIGTYQLDLSSIYADRFGQLALRARLFRPVTAAKAA